MKYLRKFNESKYEEDLKDDIRQIFSDLTDDKCDITISRIDTTNYILLSNKNQITNYIRFSDIKEELLRLKDYLGDRWIRCGVVFAGDPERIHIDINEDNYDELNNNYPEISNLAVFFNI